MDGGAQRGRKELQAGSSSPTTRRFNAHERTTTVRVPLKGLSDSEAEEDGAVTPKKGRGRPRKSNGTPVQAKKGRDLTATRKSSKTRRSIGDLVDGDDEDDVDFRIGSNVELGRGKGKSRSRSTKGAARKSLSVAGSQISEDVASSAPPKRGRGRPRKSLPLETPIDAHNGDHATESLAEAFTPQQQVQEDELDSYSMNSGRQEYENPVALPDDERSWNSHLSNHERSSQQFIHDLQTGTPPADAENQSANDVSPEQLKPSEEAHDGLPQDIYDSQAEGEYAEEDELGELVEFDTILESEGFSMISVDSVPSLRQHLSSPVNQDDITPRKPLNKITNNLRETAPYNDSFSAIPDEILAAATPARKDLGHSLLSVPATAEKSFSSVPAHILEAATPGPRSYVSKLRMENSKIDDSFSSIAPEILEAATPGRILSERGVLDKNANRDKDIGNVTPIDQPLRVFKSRISDRPSSSTSKQPLPFSSAKVERHRSISAAQSTTSTRLMTPEETPSPGEESSNGSQKSTRHSRPRISDGLAAVAESSFMQTYMPSSPPSIPQDAEEFVYTGKQPLLQPHAIETPSIMFSSPSLPPPPKAAGEHNASQSYSEHGERPVQAAARAGQALQSIVVPSSPRSRSNSLGSPFKSPMAQRRSSVSYPYLPSPSQEHILSQPPRIDYAVTSSGASRRSRFDHSLRQEDPFRNMAPQHVSPIAEPVKQHYTLGFPARTRITNSRFSSIRSADVSTLSDGAMSWQPEEEITIPVPNTSKVAELTQTEFEQRWTREQSEANEQVNSGKTRQSMVQDSIVETNVVDIQQDDEGLQLLLDTINSSSPVKITQEQLKDTLERPPRGKIPSPWRQNSKRLVYSDELAEIASPVTAPAVPFNKGYINQHRAQADLLPRTEVTPILSDDDAEPLDMSGFQIPQKSNFKPKPRKSGNLELAALMSPIRPLPTMPKTSILEKPVSDDLALSNRLGPSKNQRPSSDDISEMSKPFAPIPQKAGFNPSPRKTSFSKPTLFSQQLQPRQFTPSDNDSSTFASHERSPLITKQPQHLNLSHAPSEQGPPSPLASDDSALYSPPAHQSAEQEKENTPFHQNVRTLNWAQNLHLATQIVQTPLPEKHISPTKSCFRTPAPATNTSQSPSKNVVFVSSSPEVPSPSPEEILSATTWSRNHWLLLRSIIATHKPTPNNSPEGKTDSASAGSGSQEKPRRRRNSTRVISKLLGRKVSSQGEEMRFEQWHLEAVDEFRNKVPGWEEKYIAMRLFAILVGAEQRAAAKEAGGVAL